MCNSIKIEALINSLSKEIAELEEKLKVLENENRGLKKVIEVNKKNQENTSQIIGLLESKERGIFRYKNKYILPEKIYKNVMTRFLEGEIMPEIKNVMFGENSVEVIWDDETDTIVKSPEIDDREKMLLLAIVKKLYSENDDWYLDELKIWCKTSRNEANISDNEQEGK